MDEGLQNQGVGEKPVTTDSKGIKNTFYGILNAQGDFWTPLAFESEARARQHITDFWGSRQPDMAARCLRDFRIVPVRIRLTALPSPGGYNDKS